VCVSATRNFCIIAHIDHGKSTLADRLMQMTGAVPPGSRPQYLDKLQVGCVGGGGGGGFGGGNLGGPKTKKT